MTAGVEFDEWVTARSPALLRSAYLMCGDRHLAEDLVQSALLKAFRHWHRVLSADSPEAYVRGIVVKEFLSWRRRRSSREQPVERPPEPSYDDPALAAVDPVARDRVWALLATLPPRQRVVLVLRLYEDLDDPTIARVLGCAGATVRSLASRGLATLRSVLVGAELNDGLPREVP